MSWQLQEAKQHFSELVRRALDEGPQVVTRRGEETVVVVLLREHRDLESARAFFDQTIARRGVRPRVVITDKHAADRRAVRRRAWRAAHIRTGPHRARGETPKPIERAHVPVKDRVRPMRGLQSIATGQRLLEGIDLAQALRQRSIRSSAGQHRALPSSGPQERAREAAGTFAWLARRLAQAA